MAALTPQAKESGEDSPSLPLKPSHLSHTSPAAIYFTGTDGSGDVTLPADGRALAVQHSDKGLSRLITLVESNRNEEEPESGTGMCMR